jgi:hypothetical protein
MVNPSSIKNKLIKKNKIMTLIPAKTKCDHYKEAINKGLSEGASEMYADFKRQLKHTPMKEKPFAFDAFVNFHRGMDDESLDELIVFMQKK